jgi:CheY-like chemotaxis protein
MKVLIIDDEEDTRSIASMSLSILGGVDVVEAEGGLEGIAKAEQDRPDVILLDMMMPVMDGIATLGELQKNAMTNDIPVIFLTAKAMTSEIDRLIRMGAIAVLTKPFDPTTLSSQVENILQTRGLRVTPNSVPSGEQNNSGANQAPAPPTPQPQMAPQPMAPPPMPSQQQQQPTQASQYSTGAYPSVPQQNYNTQGPPQHQQHQQQQQQPQNQYQNQPSNHAGQMNQQQMHPGNNGELTQQQRLLQQSVTSDYATPNHAKPAVYLRNTQQDFPLQSHGDSGQGQNQSQNQGQGYNQNNGTYNGQTSPPRNQQSSGQQQVPQAWKNHQQPQPPYDGQQQWAPQPLTSQNLDGPRPYNEQKFQPPPYPVPNQNDGQNHQGSQSKQDFDQRVSGQIEAVQPKRLTLEELHYQQSITGGYPPNPRKSSNNQSGNGSTSGSQNGASQARTPEKSAESDPWVAAANANVQSTSAKFIAPKLTVPGAETPAPTSSASSAPAIPAPAKVKPPAAKVPEEPRQKKFAHPWGPAKAPNWSQGGDDDSSEDENDSEDE